MDFWFECPNVNTSFKINYLCIRSNLKLFSKFWSWKNKSFKKAVYSNKQIDLCDLWKKKTYTVSHIKSSQTKKCIPKIYLFFEL